MLENECIDSQIKGQWLLIIQCKYLFTVTFLFIAYERLSLFGPRSRIGLVLRNLLL